MATHSSILACKIPWTEEPGGLQSMGLQRVGHDRATKHTHTHILVMKFTEVYIQVNRLLLTLTNGYNASSL